AEDTRCDASLVSLGNNRPRPLFGQSLPQILRREADLFPELDELLFRELLGAVCIARRALELGRPRQHALELRAIEPCGGRTGSRRIGHKLNTTSCGG